MKAAITSRLKRDRRELRDPDITDNRREWLKIRIADYETAQKWLSRVIRERGERATK